MPPTRREKQYAATSAEIKDTARRLMADNGTAGVSLRAIARAMELSAPSLYHYFPSRDALITALIVDAFNALANALEHARDGLAEAPVGARLMAVALAYRTWALAHPIDFQLLYGNPIPGYEAPRDVTVPAVVRGFVVIIGLLMEAFQRGELAMERCAVPAPLVSQLSALRDRDDYSVPIELLYLATAGWVRMHGIIMLELFNHIQPVGGDGATFYCIQREDLFRASGLNV